MEPIKFVGNTAHVSLDRYQCLLNSEKELIEIKKHGKDMVRITTGEYSDLIKAKEELMNLKSPDVHTEVAKQEPFSLGSKVEVTEQKIKGEKSVEEILAARRKTHGDFKKQAMITDNLKYHMKNTENWSYLTAVQKEALDVIAHKIGRILAGDPNLKDHWDDIAGYSMLSAKELT